MLASSKAVSTSLRSFSIPKDEITATSPPLWACSILAIIGIIGLIIGSLAIKGLFFNVMSKKGAIALISGASVLAAFNVINCIYLIYRGCQKKGEEINPDTTLETGVETTTGNGASLPQINTSSLQTSIQIPITPVTENSRKVPARTMKIFTFPPRKVSSKPRSSSGLQTISLPPKKPSDVIALMRTLRNAFLVQNERMVQLVTPLLTQLSEEFRIDIRELRNEAGNSASTAWRKVQEKLELLEIQTRRFTYPNERVHFIIATLSSCLATMERVAFDVSGPQKYALISSTVLVKNNIVPLTSELRVRKDGLGVPVCSLIGTTLDFFQNEMTYISDPSFKFDPLKEQHRVFEFDPAQDSLEDLKIAVLRLTYLKPENVNLNAIKAHIQNHILPKYKQAFPEWRKFVPNLAREFPLPLDFPTHRLKPGEPIGVQESNGVFYWGIVLAYNKEINKYLCITSQQMTTWASPQHLRICPPQVLNRFKIEHATEGLLERWDVLIDPRAALGKIIKLFETVQPLTLSPHERGDIMTPFPVIWGSKNPNPTPLPRGRAAATREVYGPLILGKDIHTVFVAPSHMARVHDWLERRNLASSVTVLGLSHGHYLRLKNRLVSGTGAGTN